ncbi:hypothetical protein N5U55_00140 [Aliarcobacter butzleri]|uniref:hypothetical protein n=1 Tax=Aliarcobacter butzleri TaxID=28197 RepID=UPI0021B353F7|nr:hypothetical protein [Aliarcobacter butzleri]MCT7582514.1 hypothetical protein [Aliarcobacter butzleri]
MLIKIIDCTESYNQDIEGIVTFFTNYFNALNIKSERIKFKDYRIVTCTQCRCCTQIKGEEPVKCVIKDDMNPLLDKIEKGDAYIILEDRNDLFNKNKVHEKVESRLIAYHYWPYGQTDSILRKPILKKTSILINYNTTKYFMNHSFYTTKISMEDVSASIGAEVLDWQVIIPTNDLIKDYAKRLKELADLLINSLKK